MGTFALGLPLGLGAYLFRHQGSLHAPATRQRIGWLYSRNSEGSEGWELFEVSRKLWLIGALVVFPAGWRAPIATISMCGACCLLNFYRPYLSKMVVVVMQIMYFLTFIKYLLTIVFAPSQTAGNANIAGRGHETLGWLFIAFDLLVMLGCVICIVAAFVVLPKEIRRRVSRRVSPLVSAVKAGAVKAGAVAGLTVVPKQILKRRVSLMDNSVRSLVLQRVRSDHVQRVAAMAHESATRHREKTGQSQLSARARLKVRIAKKMHQKNTTTNTTTTNNNNKTHPAMHQEDVGE